MFKKKIFVYVFKGGISFCMGFDTLNDDLARYAQDEFLNFVLRELLVYFLFKIFFVEPKTGKRKTSTMLSVYTLKQK